MACLLVEDIALHQDPRPAPISEEDSYPKPRALKPEPYTLNRVVKWLAGSRLSLSLSLSTLLRGSRADFMGAWFGMVRESKEVGQGDVVSIFDTPRTQIISPAIRIVNLLSESP